MDTQLIIVSKALSNGSHDFDFQLDKSFFESFENEDVLNAALGVRVHIRKVSTVEMEIRVAINGQVSVTCDRCLEPMSLDIQFEETLTEDEMEEYLDIASGELDLGQYVYDSVCVSMPLQCCHKEGECDAQMLDIWQQNRAHQANETGAFDSLKDLIK